ncbi:MAG: DUF2141 domain-containing protein [Bacteroidales bacterium]|nr:DUF2141 domain-containing protein [Bacteroidales bacterium]MDD4216664.1 DUF2141 domain-containing protein [Bacteroidales bacterium]MDY0141524.1 DUF2141 domain-containing protein [Bacteroidales bacterium]
MKLKYLFAVLCLLMSVSMFSQQTSITINVNNIRNSKGTIKWAVFKDGSKFNSKSGYADAGSTVAEKGSTLIKTKNIPDGTYAISVFHDENNNSDVDFSFIGMPVEGFGFSQNPRIYFGPPKYKECTFTKKGNTTQNIKMKYYL